MLVFLEGLSFDGNKQCIDLPDVEDCSEDFTVEMLKRMIENDFGIAWELHDLHLQDDLQGGLEDSASLHDWQRIQDVGIQEGCSLVVRQNQLTHANIRLSDMGIARQAEVLCRACVTGHTSAVKLLLSAGVDPNTAHRDALGTPLSLAAWKGFDGVVEALLVGGADPNGQDDEGRTPLSHCAMQCSQPEGVTRALCRSGADVNHQDHLGRTPLMLAVQRGNRAFLWEVMRNNSEADLDLRDKAGKTALMMLCASQHREVLEDVGQLVARRCGLEVEDILGRTALYYAVGNPSLVAYLLHSQAEAGHRDVAFQTPLHRAVHLQNVAAASLLLQSGSCPPNPTRTHPPEGGSALMHACRLGNVEMVKLLLQHGADPNICDDEWKTAHHHCASPEICELLG